MTRTNLIKLTEIDEHNLRDLDGTQYLVLPSNFPKISAPRKKIIIPVGNPIAFDFDLNNALRKICPGEVKSTKRQNSSSEDILVSFRGLDALGNIDLNEFIKLGDGVDEAWCYDTFPIKRIYKLIQGSPEYYSLSMGMEFPDCDNSGGEICGPAVWLKGKLRFFRDSRR
jgi:hypothetical protein